LETGYLKFFKEEESGYGEDYYDEKGGSPEYLPTSPQYEKFDYKKDNMSDKLEQWKKIKNHSAFNHMSESDEPMDDYILSHSVAQLMDRKYSYEYCPNFREMIYRDNLIRLIYFVETS
jgi:hypothetical protein